MKRCWLHIGMHKTGSTTLQVSLASVVNPVGWKYITVGRGVNMGGAMHTMFATNPHENYWLVQRGHTAEQVAADGMKLRSILSKAIEECSEENLIISGESLCSIDKNGISAIRDFLNPLCDEIRIIGYVRPPIEFKISFFQQRLKHRKCEFKLKHLRLKYYERFNKFDEVFGKENVLLRKFQPASFATQCVVGDFCEQVGIQAPDRDSTVRMNESLCREACGILYAYRKFGPAIETGADAIRANKQLLAPLLAMRGTKLVVSRSLVISSLAKELKDLKWMEKRLGTSLLEDMEGDGTEISNESDGTEIRDEDDILRIEGSSCQEFAARFKAIHKIQLPEEMIPVGSPVDPRRVAEFVGYCQNLCLDLCRERIKEKRALNAKPLPQESQIRKPRKPHKLRIFRKCWRYFKKITGSGRGS